LIYRQSEILVELCWHHDRVGTPEFDDREIGGPEWRRDENFVPLSEQAEAQIEQGLFDSRAHEDTGRVVRGVRRGLTEIASDPFA
jgi:hypothetical protein